MPTNTEMPSPTAETSRIPAMCARVVGTAVLASSLFLFVLSTPLGAVGVWFQTEPVAAGLLAIGAAAGLCVLALDLTGHSIGILLARRHVQILLLFLAWNAFVSPFHGFPGRTWFGTPETGEGVLTFLALASLMLLAMALWPYRASRIVLVVATVLAAGTVGGMHLQLTLESAWRPEKYTGYAGLLGPPVALVVIGASRRADWRILAIGLLCGMAPVALSQNKTAIVLLALIGPVTFFPTRWFARGRDLAGARRWLAWLPIVAAISTMAVIGAVTAYGEYDPLYSVRSRGQLILAGLLGFYDHPMATLTGFGWGSYNDLLYQHTYLAGVHGFTDGKWDPNWEAVGAGAFHPHNDIVEAVLSGGLIGVILYLVFFTSVVAGARRGMLVVGAVGWFLVMGSLCFWYPFMLCYPFLALAIAATTAPLGVIRSSRPVPMERWVFGSGLALSVLLGWGCALSYGDARAGADRLAALNRQDPAEIPVYGGFAPDHARGGVHLWWLALSETAFIAQQLSDGHPPTPAQAQWFARMLAEADTWTASGRASMRLEALTLAMRTELIANHEHTALAPLRERELPRWEGALLRVLRDAPDRTDVAVPYLAYLVQHGDYAQLSEACGQIEAIHPDDRVCQWYRGAAMLGDPAKLPAALRLMHAALLQHVEAVAPVPNAARDMVEANWDRGKP